MSETVPGHAELVERITEYLSLGGLWNPELMDHEKVRDLLIDCRAALRPEAAGQGEALDRAWQELIEMDDRTSPEECPDMALITKAELGRFMNREDA